LRKLLVNGQHAHWLLAKDPREEPDVAEKPEFVDTISEATKQKRRRAMPRIVDLPPVVKETSRLSHWPPERWTQWRIENLTPWKLKPWKVKDWD
jgi:hypothetical protein